MPDMPMEVADKIDQITSAGTYGGAAATAVSVALNWLSANQSGLTVLVMIVTGLVTVASALYGMYHRHRLRKIAERQGVHVLLSRGDL